MRLSLVLGILMLCLGALGVGAAEPVEVPPERALELKIIEETNKERVAAGLMPLEPLDKLAECARLHSDEMLRLNYFSHNSPTPGRAKPWDRVEAIGVNARLVGENIYNCEGYGLDEVPQLAMGAWMKSSGHRANILKPNFRKIGVGIVSDGEHTYVTQVFTGEVE